MGGKKVDKIKPRQYILVVWLVDTDLSGVVAFFWDIFFVNELSSNC